MKHLMKMELEDFDMTIERWTEINDLVI